MREGAGQAIAAASALASVQARYAMAMRCPRNWDQVRTGLLHDCGRPNFASSARYNKPIGRGVTGPSIRFVEAALRHMSNIHQGSTTIYDDLEKRVVRLSVTDLESNTTYEQEITLAKTVERKKLATGQIPISSRTNSNGDIVYLVEASEDDLQIKEAAARSKAIRTLGLRLIPSDLVDEAMELIDETIKNKAAKDPDSERKKLVDAFVSIGIQPKDLVEYLQHELTRLVPGEIAELRSIYQAIRDGEAVWSDYVKPQKENSKAAELIREIESKRPTVQPS
jgi:hypothetical protein